ncbi:MFS transporter [Acidimicrobiia bacterium EGI L10123]|uniref:MFS transporter n=1 Tax=Salinilacustrithrix flava TaxID=2957203 RepID=UPI003D7C33E4|nr:MFS transporter [Acidimicrobiia bacterium EGI L10123]
MREQVREPLTAITDVFRNPGLGRVNLALGGSETGDWAYGVAVSIYAYLEGGATTVGVLGVVRFVSAAIASPLTSTLADRGDRKRIMVGADLVRFVLVALATLVVAVDGPALAVYAAAVLATLTSTAFRPAQASIIPQLARHPDELTAANVASSTIESLASFLGPAIAGVLLAVAGLEVVFAFNAVTFLWSAAVLARLEVPDAETGDDAGAGPPPSTAPPEPTPALVGASEPVDVLVEPNVAIDLEPVSAVLADALDEPAKESFLTEASQGFRTIWRSPDLRVVVGVYSAQTVVAGASLVFTVAVALDLLGLGESSVGILDASLGVGGMVGAVVALVLAQRGSLARDFGFGVFAWAAPLLLVAAVPELWAALVAMVLIGLANAVVDVNAFTVLQRLVPDEVMGRVFGAMESALIGAMAIGSLAMPLLIVTVGLRPGLVIVGGVVCLIAVAAMPRLRHVDAVALAPAGLDSLRSLSMLAPLPLRVLERLARSSEVHRFAAGATIFAEGDDGDRFYVIEEGEVAVSIGREEVGRLVAGGCFGEIALLRDVPRTATVRALTDVRCRSLSQDVFVPAVTGHGGARAQAEQVVDGWLGSV